MFETSHNNRKLAIAKIRSSENKVDAEVMSALGRARAYRLQEIKYEWGSKTEQALDCSGLVAKCYPMLYEGVPKQYEQMKGWLFDDFDLRFVEQGDIIFFAEVTHPTVVSHVGVAEDVVLNRVTVIHSSQSRGGVVTDTLDLDKNRFREIYFAVAIGKIRPFLFRHFLYDEIMEIA